jgi:predicted protein tyrosine phosphatase
MNVLFVCSRNRKRSPTAEELFAGYEGVEISSAGTATDSENPVSLEQIEWADVIFAMEEVHRRRLKQKFADVLGAKRLIVLKIADRYEYMDAELVELLKRKVSPFLKA